jgi:hypothetical protein
LDAARFCCRFTKTIGRASPVFFNPGTLGRTLIG